MQGDTKLITVEDFTGYLSSIWEDLPVVEINVRTGWTGTYHMEAWEIGKEILTGRAGGLMFVKSLKGLPCKFSLNGTEISQAELYTKLGIDVRHTV